MAVTGPAPDGYPTEAAAGVRPELADGLRPAIPGFQMAAREGPACMGHAFAAFEIQRVQHGAPAFPMVGGAAQPAQPDRGEVLIGPPGIAVAVAMAP